MPTWGHQLQSMHAQDLLYCLGGTECGAACIGGLYPGTNMPCCLSLIPCWPKSPVSISLSLSPPKLLPSPRDGHRLSQPNMLTSLPFCWVTLTVLFV